MEAEASLQEKIRALVQEYGLEACCDCLQVSIDEQQQINQAILEASFDGFLLVDKEGWIQSCNQAALNIFGYSATQELVGTHIMGLVGGTSPATHKRHFQNPPKPLPGSRIMTHMRDVPAKHKSGVEFRVTIGLCFLELNSKRHYVAFVRDLTKQKRQDELHQATFDASFDPIVLTNSLGVIQTVNQALLDEFCYKDSSALIGESISKLMPEIDCLIQDLVGRRDREMTAFRSDGSKFPIKLGVQTIKADHIHELHLVGFIRNITDEKKAMQVTKMQGEIRAQEAKVETERAMTAYFAHELRNPLGAIDSALATMPEDVAKNANETKELHKSIRLCTAFMAQVMKNLLDVRQLEQGQMALHPNPLDLKGLLSDVHAMLLPSVRAGVEFRCVVDMENTSNWVLGDAHRLQQVLTSVTTHAINYTTSGSISLSMRWSDDDYQQVVRFECTDTGPGIPKNEQGQLFQRFVNQDGAPGTGLGLAIAKQIVEIMGGTICFRSDPEVSPGSTCVAMLPLQKTAAPNEILQNEKKNEAPILEALKILVVDDIKMVRKMVTRRFKKIAPNSVISEACTGEEAISICDRESFDVMIVDNYMEGAGGVMHGTDAVLAMRRRDIGSLIIGCSGNDLEQEFKSAGADFFWGKPLPSDAEIVRQVRFRTSTAMQEEEQQPDEEKYN